MKIDAYEQELSRTSLTPLYRRINVRLAASGDVELIKSNLREVADGAPDIQLKDNSRKIVAALPTSTVHELAFKPRMVVNLKRRSKQPKNIVLDILVSNICSIETHALYLTSVISSCLKGIIYGSTKTLKTSFIFEFLGGPAADGFFFTEGKREINHHYGMDRDTKRWAYQRFTNQSNGMNVLVKRRRFDKFLLPHLSTQVHVHASYSGGVESLQFNASDYRQANSIYYADYMSAYDDGVLSSKQLCYIQRNGMQRFFWRLNEQRQVDTLESIWRYVYLLHNLDYALRLRTELSFLENALSTSYVKMLTRYMRENKITLFMTPGAGKPNVADILEWARLNTELNA